MGTCIVMVEQLAAGVCFLERMRSKPPRLGQAGTEVPLGLDCLPPLEQDRGHMTGFGEYDHIHLFGSASRSFEFHRKVLTRGKPD